MKRYLLAAAVVLSLTGPSCIKRVPPTVVTEQGKIAYTADQVAIRVNELEAAAISAQAQGGLDLQSTRTIVKFSVSADKVLQVTPEGWQQTLVSLWAETKKRLPPADKLSPVVQAAFLAVDAVLASQGL